MPRLTDKDAIRAILRRDPAWCVYALGDLSPEMFPKTEWFTPDLSLVLKDYGTSILFAMGAGSIDEALGVVTWPVHLQVRSDALDAVRQRGRVTETRDMWRMIWRGDRVPRDADDRVIRLSERDVAALRLLYADGEVAGESPDFFYPAMLTRGVFFGVYEERELVA